MHRWRTIALVFLPFVSAYYLAYLFRTINALIANSLTSDLGLDVAELGLLTSVFFLSFAAIQLPLGVWLDRFGPRRVQIVLLPIAAAGALLFSRADGLLPLLLGRALIGVGVAAALMAGLKAIVLWFPQERLPLANGCFITVGALGAVSATVPAELLLAAIGRRGLFEVLAAVTLGSAVLIYLVVPEKTHAVAISSASRTISLKAIYTDPQFWRLAPLSATCVGTAWALQGLWAAPWLADVERLDQPLIVQYLFMMAVSVCGAALALGVGADLLLRRRRRRGIAPRSLLAIIAMVFIAAQLALILRWSIPSYLLWAIIAGVGAATVLSFAILAEHFPKEIAGQANAALNFLHVTAAFVVQSAIGVVIQQWESADGRYPLAAYQTAFALGLVMQIAALAWFFRPVCFVSKSSVSVRAAFKMPFGDGFGELGTLDLNAGQSADQQFCVARTEARRWRRTAFASALLVACLGTFVAKTAGEASVPAAYGETDRIGSIDNLDFPAAPFAVSDAQIAYILRRFVENIRACSTDPVVVHKRWLDAYDFTTSRAARALDDHIRSAQPFVNIGTRPVVVEVNSVRRVSEDTFELRWHELAYAHNGTVAVENYFGRISIVSGQAMVSEPANNPFGVFVDAFAFSPDALRDDHQIVNR